MNFIHSIQKMPLFWKIFSGIALFFVLLLITGLILLASFLTAFENSQPVHVAEEIFQDYFLEGRYAEALELAEYPFTEFETADNGAAFLTEMAKGKKFAFYSVPAGEGKAQFNVVLTDPVTNETPAEEKETTEVIGISSTKVATIHLLERIGEPEWGFYTWKFDRLEFHIKAKETVKITLPSDSVLTLNGVTVSEAWIAESTPHAFNEFLPENATGITLTTYKVSGLFAKPDTRATDRNGVAHALETDEETAEMTALLNYDETLLAEQGERMMTGMKEYAKHIQADVHISAVRPYFDPDSLFFRHILENPGIWVRDHNGYSFRNELIENFYAFDEDNFCFHISFDHVLHSRGKEDYVDHLDMIVFARRIDGEFRIFERFNL